MPPCIPENNQPQRVSLKFSAPMKAIAGSLRNVVLRIPHLPSVVGPPTEGSLRLGPLMPPRPPCNIVVDPKVCKGSVFAVRRKAAFDAKSSRNSQSKEAKYRVGVIRSQLETTLPQLDERLKRKIVHNEAPEFRLRHVQFPTVSSTSASSIDKGARSLRINSLIHQKADKRKTRTKVLRVAPTPPSSARIQYAIVNTSVQTEDTFEYETRKVVQELADSAISKALQFLSKEKQIEDLRKEAQRMKTRLKIEQMERTAVEKNIKNDLKEKNRQLEERVQRDEDAKDSKALAIRTCRQVTEASLEKILALEKLKPKMKSIGMDTRPLNKLQQHLDIVTEELQKDFFPWMFAKAEQVFRRQVTDVRVETDLPPTKKKSQNGKISRIRKSVQKL